MEIKFRVVEFKTVSPLFEMERDGIKPFTIRRVEKGDARFRSLSHASFVDWLIKITNPATGEYFYRKLLGKNFLQGLDNTQISDWMILYMGDQIREE